MSHRAPRVRVSGMIWRDDAVLLVKQGRLSSPRWMLPGGGVDPGESLETALSRELREEVGLTNFEKAHPCALVESIAPLDHESKRHIIHIIFCVQISSECEQKLAFNDGAGIDPDIHDTCWVERGELENLTLHPPIAGYLKQYEIGSGFRYFGSLWAP